MVLKGKEYHAPWRVLVGCSSPLLRPWSCRWINHLSLWRTASVTPDLWLPSKSQDIAAPWLLPNYAAGWQRRMCEQLARGRYLTAEWLRVELATSWVALHTLTITPPCHTVRAGPTTFVVNGHWCLCGLVAIPADASRRWGRTCRAADKLLSGHQQESVASDWCVSYIRLNNNVILLLAAAA